jgi:hypothetical protein
MGDSRAPRKVPEDPCAALAPLRGFDDRNAGGDVQSKHCGGSRGFLPMARNLYVGLLCNAPEPQVARMLLTMWNCRQGGPGPHSCFGWGESSGRL